MGRHGDEIHLGVAQGGEAAAERAAGVDVDGAVDPTRLRHGRVPVDDAGLPAVLRGPVVTDHHPELVRLAGGLAEEGEVPHPARRPALEPLLQARVGDHETPPVQDVVADEPVQKRGDLIPELRGLISEPLHRFGEAVLEPDVLAAQRADELRVVVAGHAEGGAGGGHAHDQAQHLGRLRAAVHEVPEEDRTPPLRRADLEPPVRTLDPVTELL